MHKANSMIFESFFSLVVVISMSEIVWKKSKMDFHSTNKKHCSLTGHCTPSMTHTRPCSQRRPIHQGLLNWFLLRKEWEAAMNNISRDPNATRRVDKFRELPLHTVFRQEGPLPTTMLAAMLESYPNGPQVRNLHGDLPCHIACSYGISLEGIKLLLRCYPEAAYQRNSQGMTPLECAQQTLHSWKCLDHEKEQVIAELCREPAFWGSFQQQALLHITFERTRAKRIMPFSHMSKFRR